MLMGREVDGNGNSAGSVSYAGEHGEEDPAHRRQSDSCIHRYGSPIPAAGRRL